MPWERGAELTNQERERLIPSLQVFQQGEAQGGGYFYRCVRDYAMASGDLDYIEAHLGEDTSLRQLAELVRLSPDHFAALFRQSIGLPPHRYVLERRIVRAKELLAGDRLTLAEIGYALGYTSQPHFITMFRKLTGMTPGAYRKVGRHKHAAQGVAAYSGFPEDP